LENSMACGPEVSKQDHGKENECTVAGGSEEGFWRVGFSGEIGPSGFGDFGFIQKGVGEKGCGSNIGKEINQTDRGADKKPCPRADKDVEGGVRTTGYHGEGTRRHSSTGRGRGRPGRLSTSR
jgi:hypothetical protein